MKKINGLLILILIFVNLINLQFFKILKAEPTQKY